MAKLYAVYVNSVICNWNPDNMIQIEWISPSDAHSVKKSYVGESGNTYKFVQYKENDASLDVDIFISNTYGVLVSKVLHHYLKRFTTNMDTISVESLPISVNYYSIHVVETLSGSSIWVPCVMWALGIATLAEYHLVDPIKVEGILSRILWQMLDEKFRKDDPIDQLLDPRISVIFNLGDVKEYISRVTKKAELYGKAIKVQEKINAISGLRDVELVFSEMLEDIVTLNDIIQESEITIHIKNKKTGIDQHVFLDMNTEPNSYKAKVCGHCDVIYADPACKTDKQ